MSEKEIDMKINIGTEYDASGVDRANEDLARFESSYKRRKEEATAMAEAGATHDEIRAETGIELLWDELQKARSAYVKATSEDIEELKREKEHYIRLRREELELKKARGEISKEDYDYGKRKIAMEEELHRVEIREHEAKLKLIEAQYDALHKRVQAGKSGKEKDEKAALIAQEKLLEAELEVELASAHAKSEKERQAEADASVAALRDAKKKAREERETAKNREKEAKAQRQNEAEQQRRKKRLKSLANVDLQHEYKQAKKKAKKARKGGDEKEIEEAEAEVQLYKAETKRRRRHKKAKKIRDKVEKKMPVVVDPKEIANIEEAMGILGQVERDEKLNGLGVEQLVALMKRAQETRSKRDDQLVAAIMQLVQVEENAGAKVMKELERLKRKTHKLQETAFN